MLQGQAALYDPQPRPSRVLAICFNRTLVPFLRKKIGIAYRQRTGETMPEGYLHVHYFNDLMWQMARSGLWRYQPVSEGDNDQRARQYLNDFKHARLEQPDVVEQCLYDAIYVDEGQDFSEEEFRLLQALCRCSGRAEANLYVFYDDAQNLYARARPNWQSLGLNVRGGRAHVMSECFRNTRQIIEPAFNVLYGTCASGTADIPTRNFGDLSTLEQKQLIAQKDGLWHVSFARREGHAPRISTANNLKREERELIARLEWLLVDQQVRAEDVLVLTMRNERAQRLAQAIERADLPIARVHLTTQEKDRLLGERKQLTVSTVASAKGYDRYCVLLASVGEFSSDVTGRASFYVGCTRAIEYLELFGGEDAPLLAEFKVAMKRLAESRSAVGDEV